MRGPFDRLAPVAQELTLDELNQLTVEPVQVEMEELDISSEAPLPNLMLPERHAMHKEILKIEHPEFTNKQREVALELLLKNNDCLSLNLGELGCTKGIQVEIDTGNARPI